MPKFRVGDKVHINDEGLEICFGSRIGLSPMKKHVYTITKVDKDPIAYDGKRGIHVVGVDEKELNNLMINEDCFDLALSDPTTIPQNSPGDVPPPRRVSAFQTDEFGLPRGFEIVKKGMIDAETLFKTPATDEWLGATRKMLNSGRDISSYPNNYTFAQRIGRPNDSDPQTEIDPTPIAPEDDHASSYGDNWGGF